MLAELLLWHVSYACQRHGRTSSTSGWLHRTLKSKQTLFSKLNNPEDSLMDGHGRKLYFEQRTKLGSLNLGLLWRSTVFLFNFLKFYGRNKTQFMRNFSRCLVLSVGADFFQRVPWAVERTCTWTLDVISLFVFLVSQGIFPSTYTELLSSTFVDDQTTSAVSPGVLLLLLLLFFSRVLAECWRRVWRSFPHSARKH
jgi:hypothetical protein